MMLILRDDQVIETFESADNPPSWIEWIDVKNAEYTFSDDRGQMYEGRLDHAGGLFRGEKWHLVPVGIANPNNAIALIERAVAVDPDYCASPDLESLRRRLEMNRRDG